MTQTQNTAFYYVRRQGKLIGPLSMERISYCCSRNLLSGEDAISSDQVNWTSISAYNAYLREETTYSEPLNSTESSTAEDGITPERAAMDPAGKMPRISRAASFLDQYRVLLLIALAALAGCGLLSTGAYFAYNYFSGSTFVTSDVRNLYEVLLWENSLNEKKKTAEQLWKKARELAQQGNLMLSESIYTKKISSDAAGQIREKKYRKEIFDILLQKKDPWAMWIKLAGEQVLICDFLGKKATSLDRLLDQENNKTYLCVPMRKIQLDEIHKLISQTDNISLLFTIVARMSHMDSIWQRVEDKAKSPYKQCIHLIARRLEELHFNALAYYIDATYYYSKGSHDHLTVLKKTAEENNESEKFKLEVLDFQGKGFFIVHNGTIRYKHISGKHPYRVKIDGEGWNTSSSYILLDQKLSACAVINSNENVKSRYFKKKLYIIPQKPGAFESRIQIFKRLDLATE